MLTATQQADPVVASVTAFIVIVLLIALYWLPTAVAVLRKRQIAAVAVINGLLGWTFLGWVAALAMAVSNSSAREA